MAWLENAQFDTNTFPRKKQRIYDEENEKWITLHNPPIQGRQSLAKGTSIALVRPVEFSTASWRRAVMSLEEQYKAWLLWSYSGNIRFEYQIEITRWGWGEFIAHLGSKKIVGKTVDRLRPLIWLAAQDVKAELAGRDVYRYQVLEQLVGVEEKNWSKTFTGHWLVMRSIFLRLDQASLLGLSKTRSEQIAANYQHGIAKVD